MEELKRFNFWSKEVDDYETDTCAFICNSDQGGSQDDGGASCNVDGNG